MLTYPLIDDEWIAKQCLNNELMRDGRLIHGPLMVDQWPVDGSLTIFFWPSNG